MIGMFFKIINGWDMTIDLHEMGEIRGFNRRPDWLIIINDSFLHLKIVMCET